MLKDAFQKISQYLWELPASFRQGMRTGVRVYSSDKLWGQIEEESLEQLMNCAFLPGIVGYAFGMPDIHSGYGPPIGGVGAMETHQGIISPGFVGFDENCGVRLLKSSFNQKDIEPYLGELANGIENEIPSGLGRGRKTKLSINQINEILDKGVPGLVEQGYGLKEDVENCEEGGYMRDADSVYVSDRAKNRGRDQLGTLGSGNHFLEIQAVEEIYDKPVAEIFGLSAGQIVVMIHTGSRGLGHQNCSDYLKSVLLAMPKYKISVPDKELACAPLNSPEGQNFLKAMSAACNFAWANRQIITYYVRKVFKEITGGSGNLVLLYDVAHNIAKIEEHEVNQDMVKLIVHRKGATRALPAGHSGIPERYKTAGQPVLIPGSMGTPSYVCVGTEKSKEAWYTVNHGAGRIMSRHSAVNKIRGEDVIKGLQKQGILVKCHSARNIAEEAPLAYKNINDVVEVVQGAGLARKVARLKPLAVVKGE
ncbi:RtcB family protein [Patescibacteria group bacterium]|nr:RtcB family protein [Patescibacteria group bacterium]